MLANCAGDAPHAACKREPLPVIQLQEQTTIEIHGTTFNIEVAREPQDLAKGLMFREELPERHGMLFIYPVSQRVVMWMKNTQIPLDMVFIGPELKVIGVAENTTPYSLEHIVSPSITRAVLELPAGSVKQYGIEPGLPVTSPALETSLP